MILSRMFSRKPSLIFLINYSQLPISFLDTSAFSGYFSLRLQFLLNCLLLTCGNKHLCSRDSTRVYFFPFPVKIFLCLVGSYYRDNFRFRQSKISRKACSKTHLILLLINLKWVHFASKNIKVFYQTNVSILMNMFK